jgi:hypothetical protein
MTRFDIHRIVDLLDDIFARENLTENDHSEKQDH